MKSVLAVTLLLLSATAFAWETTCDEKPTNDSCFELWSTGGEPVTCNSGAASLGRVCDRQSDMGVCHNTWDAGMAVGGSDVYYYFPNFQCGTGDTFATCAAKFQSTCTNAGSTWEDGALTN